MLHGNSFLYLLFHLHSQIAYLETLFKKKKKKQRMYPFKQIVQIMDGFIG